MGKLWNGTQGFTVVPQTITKDTRLDLRDSGLLLKLLSLPSGWDFSEKGLVAITNAGLTTIRTGLKHLEQYGYLKRFRVKNEKGQFIDWEWRIYTEPQENCDENESECVNGADFTENRDAEKTEIGKTEIGKTEIGKQSQLNTKESNTKELNTKIKNINDANPPSSSKIEPQEVEIVKYLNEKAEKHFRTNTADTKVLIKKLLKAGFTVDDFKSVIDNQVAKWKGNPEWDEYLRPSTLFNSKKFENYLNNKPGGKKQCEDTDTSYDLDAYESSYMYI